jgi:hypothetical protein
MGTPAIPLIISLISAALVAGGWRWGGMARWLLTGVLGPGAFAGTLWWFCEQYPNLCTLRCLSSAFQNEVCQRIPSPSPAFPSVTAIRPADPNPTSQDQVRYEVQFSQDVTGVDLSDFAIQADPTITNASVAEVQGSGSIYTILVNTGEGNGSFQLNLVDDDSIRTSGDTPLGGEGTGNGNFSGDPYTVEKSQNPSPNPPPFATSINRLDANPTAQSRVRYEVQFDQDVTGVEPTDFRLDTSVTGARVNYLQGSGSTYQIFVTTGTGNGTIQLNLVDDDSIKNGEGTPLGGVGAGNGNVLGQIYTVQRETPPPDPPDPPEPIPGLW